MTAHTKTTTTYKSKKTGREITIPDEMSERDRKRTLLRVTKGLRPKIKEAKRVGRIGSLEAQLGAPLERTAGGKLAEFDLGEPGRVLTRMDMARSQTMEGRLSKLKRDFPELETKVVDDPLGGRLIMLRRPGQSTFTMLDSDEVTTLGDAADVAGYVLNTETLLTIASTIATRGYGLLGRAGVQAIGGAAGRMGDLAIEQARGHERLSLLEIGKDAALSGGLAAVGESLFALPRRGLRAVTGRGVFELTPEEMKAISTSREAGAGGLSVGQVHPLTRRMENQAAATSKKAQLDRIEQAKNILQDMERKRDQIGGLGALDDTTIDRYIQQTEADFLGMMKVGAVDPLRGGNALKGGRKLYVKAIKHRLDRKYRAATAESEGAVYDLAEAQTLGQKHLSGVRAKAKTIPAPGPGEPRILFPAAQRGKPKGVRLTIDPKGEAATLIRRLLELDPKVKSFEDVTGFEQIKALRTQFFDLKNAPMPGQERLEHRIAGEMWSVLSGVMDDPTGGGEAFVRLHRAAAVANRRKEAILEVADMRKIANTSEFDADDLMRSVARPYNGGALRLMSRIMPDEQYRTFQEAFKSDLLSKPEQIIKRLDEFRVDPRALRMLVTPNEEATLRLIGNQYERFQGSAFKEAMKLTDPERRAVLIASKEDAVGIGRFLSKVGGKESDPGRAMRSGTIQALVESSTRIEKGVDIIDPVKAMAFIQKLQNTKKLDAIFLADEVEFLTDRKALLSFIDLSIDPGAGLQAGEIANNMGSFITIPLEPVGSSRKFVKGVKATLKNSIIGRLFLNPTIRQLIVGFGGRPLDFTTLRAIAAVGAELSADLGLLDKSKKKETAEPADQDTTNPATGHVPGDEHQAFARSGVVKGRLGAAGHGGDTVVGHLTPGEVVLPERVLSPELNARIARALAENGLNPEDFIVGGPDRRNLLTGLREFHDAGGGGFGGEDTGGEDAGDDSFGGGGGFGGFGGMDPDDFGGGSVFGSAGVQDPGFSGGGSGRGFDDRGSSVLGQDASKGEHGFLGFGLEVDPSVQPGPGIGDPAFGQGPTTFGNFVSSGAASDALGMLAFGGFPLAGAASLVGRFFGLPPGVLSRPGFGTVPEEEATGFDIDEQQSFTPSFGLAASPTSTTGSNAFLSNEPGLVGLGHPVTPVEIQDLDVDMSPNPPPSPGLTSLAPPPEPQSPFPFGMLPGERGIIAAPPGRAVTGPSLGTPLAAPPAQPLEFGPSEFFDPSATAPADSLSAAEIDEMVAMVEASGARTKATEIDAINAAIDERSHALSHALQNMNDDDLMAMPDSFEKEAELDERGLPLSEDTLDVMDLSQTQEQFDRIQQELRQRKNPPARKAPAPLMQELDLRLQELLAPIPEPKNLQLPLERGEAFV